MRKIIAIAAILLIGGMFTDVSLMRGNVNAGATLFAAAAQTKCPVMGGDIDRSKYTDYKGKRVYFCCAQCIDEFKKNPEKYMQKMKKDGVVLENAPRK